ncbi:MAG: ABC transporter ATP-binding protein [Bacillota bacterium]
MQYQLLTAFFKKHAAAYVIGLFFMFLASYILTLLPKVLGATVDIMKADRFSQAMVLHNVALMALIAIATFICTFVWRNLIIGQARNMECYLREKLFHHFELLSPEFYSTRKTGDLIAYAINDISAVRTTFGPAAAKSCNGLVILAASFYFMLSGVDFRLTLLSLAPLGLVLYLLRVIGRQIQIRFRKVQETFGAISDKVQENIGGIRVIKAFVQEELEMQNFGVLNDQMMDANMRLVKTSASLRPLIEICWSVSFGVSLVYGGNMVVNGAISLGDFVAFNSYLTMIMTPIISFGRVIAIFHRGLASLQRLAEIFAVQPAVTEMKTARAGSLSGRIELCDLTFQYPGATAPALQAVNLCIPAGQTVGVIGKTGSGKSTLAQLLLKLYNVPAGAIRLDGYDLNDYSLEAIRDGIGFVPQDIFLFSATIRENIASFKPIYSDAAIETAARQSQIYDSIRELPNGFATVLGERGVNLSGGQKQRLAIARALIKNSAILILDDALAAVDTVTQTRILHNLKEARHGKTNLIISHRVSAVAAADLIIVLENGGICEQGTHNELLQKGGVYYDIYTEQNAAVREASPG